MGISQPELDDLIHKGIVLYNRLRNPEVNAKLVAISSEKVTISFSGGFCFDCGILGYVEAFTKQFKALTNEVELKMGKTRKINPRTFEADFTIIVKEQKS